MGNRLHGGSVERVEYAIRTGRISLAPQLRTSSRHILSLLERGEAVARYGPDGIVRIVPVISGGQALGTSLPTLIYDPLAPPVPLRTLYVDWDNGDDARTVAQAQSEATPWKTISKFIANCAAGDRCYVKDRTGQTASGGDSAVGYEPTTATEHLIASKVGTAGDPIVIQAYPGHRPVVRPPLGSTPGSVIGRVFHWSGTSAYWVLVGLDIYHSSGTGGAESCTWAGSGTHHISLVGCNIHGATDGSGCYSNPDATDIQYLCCDAYENDDWRGGSNQSHGFYSQSDRTLMANCIARDHFCGFGFQIRTDGANQPTDAWIVNCVGARQGTPGSHVVKESGSVNTLVYNIIGYSSENYAVRGTTAGTADGTGSKARKNIGYLNTGTPDFANQNSNSYGFDWSSDGSGNYGSPPGDNLDNTDPKFVDPDNNDFHLQATSPAIGYGLEAYCPPFDHDFDVRSQCDAGAYAYSPASPPSPPGSARIRSRRSR